jgi:hypothetical protein
MTGGVLFFDLGERVEMNRLLNFSLFRLLNRGLANDVATKQEVP